MTESQKYMYSFQLDMVKFAKDFDWLDLIVLLSIKHIQFEQQTRCSVGWNHIVGCLRVASLLLSMLANHGLLGLVVMSKNWWTENRYLPTQKSTQWRSCTVLTYLCHYNSCLWRWKDPQISIKELELSDLAYQGQIHG